MAVEFLDFTNNRVQELSLETLKQTYKENDVYGKPLKGIYHYEVLDKLKTLCDDRNMHLEVYDLFAAQNKDRTQPGVVILPQVEEQYGKGATEAHILRRVYANMRITDFDDDTYTTNLAVAFHQKGIQVGFGNMVKICHNQCMLNPTHYASTYNDKGKKEDKSTLEELFAKVEFWLDNAKSAILTERERIEKMKAIKLNPADIFRLIGQLVTLRVRCDSAIETLRTTTTYPLNQVQINKFVEALLVFKCDNDFITLWDFYNSATELYKADEVEIPNLLTQNRAMISFLNDNYDF